MKKSVLISLLCLFLVVEVFAQDNWNSVLSRYEEICNTCIELREMIGRGERVPYGEISAVLEEMNVLREKLTKVSGTMNAEQQARFEAIRKKYAGRFGTTTGTVSNAGAVDAHEAASDTSSDTQSDTAAVTVPDSVAGFELHANFRTDAGVASGVHVGADSDLAAGTSSESDAYVAVETSFKPDMGIARKRAHQKTFAHRPPFHVGAHAAADLAETCQYGITLTGRKGPWGGRITAMTNFGSNSTSYTCTSDGHVSNGGVFWGDGTVRHAAFSISAGPSFRVKRHLEFFAGCGFWSHSTCWKDASGYWADVSDLKTNTWCVDGGAGLHAGRLVLSAGVRCVPAVKSCSCLASIGFEL